MRRRIDLQLYRSFASACFEADVARAREIISNIDAYEENKAEALRLFEHAYQLQRNVSRAPGTDEFRPTAQHPDDELKRDIQELAKEVLAARQPSPTVPTKLKLKIWNTSIVSPPGSLSKTILAFVFSRKAFDHVFAQAITDMRDEYCEALVDEDHLKAAWVRLRGNCGLWLAAVAFVATSILKKVIDVWKLIP